MHSVGFLFAPGFVSRFTCLQDPQAQIRFAFVASASGSSLDLSLDHECFRSPRSTLLAPACAGAESRSASSTAMFWCKPALCRVATPAIVFGLLSSRPAWFLRVSLRAGLAVLPDGKWCRFPLLVDFAR